jgi:hypothetical protein
MLVLTLPLPPSVYCPVVEAATGRGLPVVAWYAGWAAFELTVNRFTMRPRADDPAAPA